MKNTTSAVMIALLLLPAVRTVSAASLTRMEQLGKSMYKDNNFSLTGTQSCQTCHHPGAGFADPTNSRDPYYTVVSLGDDGVSLGGRNAPSAAYAGYSQKLTRDDEDNFYGGLFWDGRATGQTILGDPLAEQAQGPPLNPVEMNMPDKEAVVEEVRKASYVQNFLNVFGANSLDDIETAYDYIATAIAAYERSAEVQMFSSRYDLGILTEKESAGETLFLTKCSKCHSVEVTPEHYALFTDYSYHNIGIPVNTLIPVDPSVEDPTDYGLGGFLNDPGNEFYQDAPQQMGKFKVPTLRNIGLTAPYGHNGYFPTLRAIIDFKNNRNDGSYELPEVEANLNTTDIGNLGLTDAQVDDIVAFLMTLTDN